MQRVWQVLSHKGQEGGEIGVGGGFGVQDKGGRGEFGIRGYRGKAGGGQQVSNYLIAALPHRP